MSIYIHSYYLEKMEGLENYREGPLRLLTDSLMHSNKILIDIVGNKKLIGNIVGFDTHFNMILRNVKETWSEKCERRNIWVSKERYIGKMF